MELLKPTSYADNTLEDKTDHMPIYETETFKIVFFDLETGGLNMTDEILQISMKSGKNDFNSFITPTRSINYSATKVNGLSNVHSKLFKNGHEVDALPRQIVFEKILQFLKDLKKKCILVAHNCIFDSTRFITAISDLYLFDEYEKIIEGFSDTLALLRKKFLKRQNGYKLTTLASELLCILCVGAHDAKFDINLLEKICVSFIDVREIVESKMSLLQIQIKIENNKNIRKILPSFTPMKSVISILIQKRLAAYEISYDKIIETFKTKGEKGVRTLLRGDINGTPTIIKTKKTIDNILKYLNFLS